ncbi:hypothetical protein, partial [uncultured Brevundimonas sp.]|uniref:hypothetical protein n=1 Tax=uncultured Brevundimonas sp. TaxID=213418 RepID=UPI00262DD5EF
IRHNLLELLSISKLHGLSQYINKTSDLEHFESLYNFLAEINTSYLKHNYRYMTLNNTPVIQDEENFNIILHAIKLINDAAQKSRAAANRACP